MNLRFYLVYTLLAVTMCVCGQSSPNYLTSSNIVSLPAIFPGCNDISRSSIERKVCYEEKLHNFIYDNLTYPKIALKDGIQGVVVVLFSVDKYGTLSNFNVPIPVDESLAKEAIKIAKSMPTWLPAQEDGQDIASTASIAVHFKIQANTFQRPVFVPPIIPESMYENINYPSDEVFKVVENQPLFPGCEYSDSYLDRKICAEGKMLQFIYSNLNYPNDAKAEGVEGTIYLKFIVEKDGNITSPEVIRSISKSCDLEALRIVSIMPRFNPGLQRGKSARVQYNLPIKFKLE